MSADSASAAVAKIARSPKLLAEAREKAALVERLTGRLSRDQVYAALQPALVLWGAPDHGDGEEAEALDQFWLDTHTKAYRHLPREALEHGVSEWIRVGKPWFPKPSDIVRLAEDRARELRMMAYRIRMAAEAAAERNRPSLPEETRAVHQQKLADLARSLGQRGMSISRASELRQPAGVR